MTFERFHQIWTTVVTDRPASAQAVKKAPLLNGASEQTIDALVRASDGDFAYFDEIDAKLAGYDAKLTAAK